VTFKLSYNILHVKKYAYIFHNILNDKTNPTNFIVRSKKL